MTSQTKVILTTLVALGIVTRFGTNDVKVNAATEGTNSIPETTQIKTPKVVSAPVVEEQPVEETEELVDSDKTEETPEKDEQANVSPQVEMFATNEATETAVSEESLPTNEPVVEETMQAEASGTTITAGSYYDNGVIDSRIQNGDRYRAQATITNNSDTEATVRFAVAHLGDPGHIIWEVSTTVAPNSTQIVEGVSVPNDSSNDTHLMVFNDGNVELSIDPTSVSISAFPYTEEELAQLEAELYATLPEPSLDFRVNPYLQSPSDDSMRINWVSEFPEAGTVTLTEDGTNHSETKTAESTYLNLSEYTPAEIQQELSFNNGNGETQTIDQGSWLLSNSNYKNEVAFSDLKPDTTYNYTVVQGDSVFEGAFTTFPTAEEWDEIRVIAFSDTETEPLGRLENREWELHVGKPYAEGSEERPEIGSDYQEKYGHAHRNGEDLVRYPLSQTEALNENLKWIEQADADAIIIAGDLTQGAGYQPAWDEFWRHFAGEYGSIASETPLITALGNWETFAAINGGYGEPALSRNKYHDYFDTPGDADNARYKDSYYRTDIGPLTIITLDSTKGVPTEVANSYTTGEWYSGDDSVLNPDVWASEGLQGDPYMTTDTQGSFTLDEYNENFVEVYPNLTEAQSDMATFNPGSDQWNWAVEQLADARADGQIILVQFHHAPYSSGVHGTAPNFEYPDNQSGVAMRVYQPLFREYGVAAVISGHDEMFERSFIDTDNNGIGLHVYDVGVAADGLRSEKFVTDENGDYVALDYNTHTAWSATNDEPELWVTNEDGVKHLIDGGLHYGHLQIDLLNTDYGAEMTLTPVYIFPILDDNYEFVSSERRVYDDVVQLYFNEEGIQITAEEAADILALQGIENQLTALEERVSALETENDALVKELETVKSELAKANKNIEVLEGRVNELENRVANIESIEDDKENFSEEAKVDENVDKGTNKENVADKSIEKESNNTDDKQESKDETYKDIKTGKQDSEAEDTDDTNEKSESGEELPETGSANGGLVAAIMTMLSGLGIAFGTRKRD